MARELSGLRPERYWTTHLGSVKGCLNYLGRDISQGWLFGGTSHAFVVNVGSDL
jgi:hypothetical protein